MNTQTNYNIGERVRQLRIKCGLSQEQLALQADITPAYLGLVERNQRNPTVRIIEQICNTLNISLMDFFSNQTGEDRIDNTDLLSLQILMQIHDCTEEEKKILLSLIKEALKLSHNSRK